MALGPINDRAEIKKQWDVKKVLIKSPNKATWEIKPELIPAAYEILRENGMSMDSLETTKLSFESLKALVSLLSKNYDTTNISLALEQAVADKNKRQWEFKGWRILVVGTGDSTLTEQELLACKA